jgi:hypothetical protein
MRCNYIKAVTFSSLCNTDLLGEVSIMPFHQKSTMWLSVI